LTLEKKSMIIPFETRRTSFLVDRLPACVWAHAGRRLEGSSVIHLAHYPNKTICVSIPSLSEDMRPRVFKLVSIEPSGLWFENSDQAPRFPSLNHSDPKSDVHTAFIPFAQIAYVFDSSYRMSARQGSLNGDQSEASSRMTKAIEQRRIAREYGVR
jgi:hypothetical protein